MCMTRHGSPDPINTRISGNYVSMSDKGQSGRGCYFVGKSGRNWECNTGMIENVSSGGQKVE